MQLAVCLFEMDVFETGALAIKKARGARVAQSVSCQTSAQVRIARFVGSSPASGSVLIAQSLEPALDSVSPSLFASLHLARALSQNK